MKDATYFRARSYNRKEKKAHFTYSGIVCLQRYPFKGNNLLDSYTITTKSNPLKFHCFVLRKVRILQLLLIFQDSSKKVCSGLLSWAEAQGPHLLWHPCGSVRAYAQESPGLHPSFLVAGWAEWCHWCATEELPTGTSNSLFEM